MPKRNSAVTEAPTRPDGIKSGSCFILYVHPKDCLQVTVEPSVAAFDLRVNITEVETRKTSVINIRASEPWWSSGVNTSALTKAYVVTAEYHEGKGAWRACSPTDLPPGPPNPCRVGFDDISVGDFGNPKVIFQWFNR